MLRIAFLREGSIMRVFYNQGGQSMIYRTEHPKPQFRRDGWRNLNGIWAFEIDRADSGEERGYFAPDAPLAQKINVPFCPESRLSGIADRDFTAAVWYRRSFTLTETEAAGRVVLHFGAVDYLATVAVNGIICGTHKGGYDRRPKFPPEEIAPIFSRPAAIEADD